VQRSNFLIFKLAVNKARLSKFVFV